MKVLGSLMLKVLLEPGGLSRIAPFYDFNRTLKFVLAVTWILRCWNQLTFFTVNAICPNGSVQLSVVFF